LQAAREGGVTGHVALAGAVGAASVALDVAAGPLGPVLALGSEAAALGIATHAIAKVVRHHGLDDAGYRRVLAATITHAETNAYCASYSADAWRLACGVGRPHGGRRSEVVRALLRDGTKAVATGALAAAIAKVGLRVGLKKMPWVGAALRVTKLPYTALEGARLVSCVETHARLLCAPPLRRLAQQPMAAAANDVDASSVAATPDRALRSA
jgi:hypothetical protein